MTKRKSIEAQRPGGEHIAALRPSRKPRDAVAKYGEGSRNGHIGVTPKRDEAPEMAAAVGRAKAGARARKGLPGPVAGFVPGFYESAWPGLTSDASRASLDAWCARLTHHRKLQQNSTDAAEAKRGHAGLDMGLNGSLRSGAVEYMGPGA
jgi:hypothetical protein